MPTSGGMEENAAGTHAVPGTQGAPTHFILVTAAPGCQVLPIIGAIL